MDRHELRSSWQPRVIYFTCQLALHCHVSHLVGQSQSLQQPLSFAHAACAQQAPCTRGLKTGELSPASHILHRLICTGQGWHPAPTMFCTRLPADPVEG